MKKLNYIVLLVFIFGVSLSYSQQLRFKHITSEEGLSTNYVSSIIQDDKGFMWFGTQDGLNKYDGYQTIIFKNDPTNINSPSSSEITCLKQVRHDLIVVGTRDGINFFNPTITKFTRLNNLKGTNVKINAIAVYNADNIIVGADEGLFSVNIVTKEFKKFDFPIESPVVVRSIKEVGGVFFIGTIDKGLWKLVGNKLERINFVKSDIDNFKMTDLESINCLQEYAGKLYIGTNGFGIFKVDSRSFEIDAKISFFQNNADGDFIKSIEVKNNKIFGATSGGLAQYNLITGELAFFSKTDQKFSLNSIATNYVYVDSENNVWIGTNLGGINVSFSQSLKFNNSNSSYETRFTNIYSFTEEKSDEVWLGGVRSFHKLNVVNGTSENHSDILGSNTALCIVKESDNIYWVGTWGNGLIRFDKTSRTQKTFFSPEFGGTILCLKLDGKGHLYIGTVGDGLIRLNLKTFESKHFGSKEGLPNTNINTIFVDSKKNVWLGTYDGGLLKLKDFPSADNIKIDKVYKNDGKEGQIAANIILGINEDKNGVIWVSTSAGLSKLLPDGSFYSFYEKDGLPNTYLYSLLKDSLDNFWMSSNSGIIKFNPLQKESEITFKNYGIKDGLVNTEYNMGAAFTSTSGNMYFGGSNGFNVFRPSLIKDNLHSPNAYVIGYKRGGKDVAVDSFIAYKKHLKLSWRENYFQFELAALDYTEPAKNKFKYKLEGYDNDWSAPTNVRYVSYTELPGGEYTFLVKAANNDGIWNETPFEITIEVVPPFWKTKLFYFLLIVFSVGGIYGFTQYRTRAIKKENKILENKVAERTRELEEKNNDITSSITYAKRIQEAILPSKDQIFKKLKNAFILYQPKDIVSGDFYWFAEKSGWKILAVVDCTGHGVPGAFMSMIGHNLLHQIVSEKGIIDPADILNNLHKGVQEALRQGQNEINTNDGMDVSLIAINDTTKEIKWAGANRPLVTIDSTGEFLKFDGNKFPVGGAQLDINRVFTTQVIKLKNPAMAYMTSDGYADQFGGEKGKKFMVKRFHDLLSVIHLQSPEDQKKELQRNFDMWRQNHEQVDDVLVVGLGI